MSIKYVNDTFVWVVSNGSLPWHRKYSGINNARGVFAVLLFELWDYFAIKMKWNFWM
jgi:hypothetical protein